MRVSRKWHRHSYNREWYFVKLLSREDSCLILKIDLFSCTQEGEEIFLCNTIILIIYTCEVSSAVTRCRPSLCYVYFLMKMLNLLYKKLHLDDVSVYNFKLPFHWKTIIGSTWKFYCQWQPGLLYLENFVQGK